MHAQLYGTFKRAALVPESAHALRCMHREEALDAMLWRHDHHAGRPTRRDEIPVRDRMI